MQKVLVSGSAGFIGGYVVEELLRRGHSVIGVDDHSKYGPVAKSYDDHPDYRLVVGDVEVRSGNVKLAMSHVVPDLVQKVLKGQDPLHVLGDGTQVRHYTYGGDLARGIVTAMEHPAALNEDFNLSTDQATSVTELAEVIWRKVKGRGVPLTLVSDPAYEHDVQRRVPSTVKAERVLGFTATTTLDEMLDEVIPWIEKALAEGTI
jgi:UDP-glucose 4-epimerase